MPGKQKKIGEILVEKGIITVEQVNLALEEQKRTKEFFGKILLKKGWIKEKDLLGVLSEQYDIPFVSLKNKYVDFGFVKQFSPSLIMDYKCFPIKGDDWSVTFAITNPLDAWVLQKAEEEAKGLKVKLVLVLEEDMGELIKRFQEYIKGDISKLFK